jgi:transcriptional regulator with XRE-family HTH domain
MNTSSFAESAHRLEVAMSKRISTQENADFGQRLAELRKQAGYTQTELAAELDISQRMVAYYESPHSAPPANLLPQIAAVLGVSIDELFGRRTKRRLVKQDGDSRLRRRLLAIEKLDAAEKRQVLQLIDAFIERGVLKRKVESRAS